MSELWRSLTEGGRWTPRERRIGRWVGRILLVVLALGLFEWNVHMQRLGAQSQVWKEWVNTQCQTGDEATCMSYVAYANKSGLPTGRFWTENPELHQKAMCIKSKAWRTLSSIQMVDYSQLSSQCR